MLSSRMRIALVLGIVVGALSVASTASAASNIVISQVYGGGGNTGATYQHDYIELFNRGTTTLFLDGMSLQYGSSTGLVGPNSTPTQITPLSGSIGAGQYVLVREAQGTGGTTPVPADITDDTPIAMSATTGKIALVNTTANLACGSDTVPCGPAQLATIVDFVGYGGANQFEGSGPTGTLSNTTAALRADGGCVDTDQNAANFTVGAPAPRNRLTMTRTCGEDAPPSVAATTPANGATGVARDANITITFSEPVETTSSWSAISCGSSAGHTATVAGGPTTFTLNPTTDFSANETCTVRILASDVTDKDAIDPPDNMVANHEFTFTVESPPPPAVRIHEIQGASHIAAILGPVSGVVGIVTAKRSNGYYMQDPSPDANDATSEGILVFTSTAPTVNVGDSVRVSGTVVEFRPGGASSANLSITEITGPTTTVVSTGNPLPLATVVGIGGRVPPGEVIEDDAAGSVETSGVFDPSADGIDFYESLEAMRLQVNNPVVVGPRNSFGELYVLTDNGAGAAVRTARGGIVIRDLGAEPPGDYRSGDFNPERIQLDDAAGVATPNASVGDGFTTPVLGVLDYDFGNFELEVTSVLTRVDNGLTREATTTPGANELSVATFNVENLDANEPQSKFDALASQIVVNMRAPDIVSLEEIQDNNGATNDSVVDATQTMTKLVNSITAVGGPSYEFRQIDPVDDQDGGEPGGNIRVGFIFRTDRGVAFVDRPGGGSTTPTTIVSGPDGPELSVSPGRVDPANPAWNASRKPLAGEFTFRGETYFLITNHFNSKGGDQALFGRFQPPTRSTEVQRHQQAQIVNNFVDSILAVDSSANIIVLGDINDFEFSQTMSLLEGGVLHALMSTLPQDERYSYVFEGNSQSLDHIIVSNSLFGSPFAYDAVHVNAEFHDQLSDHDPQVARFLVNTAPTVDAGDPYTVGEGGSVQLTATGSDENGDVLTYEWDLDGDGTYETSGQTVTFSALSIDGPAVRTVGVRATDETLTATDTAQVTITNVEPTATFVAPATVDAGFPFTLTLTNPADPSAADEAAGFTYAFDCGSGYGDFGTANTKSCPTTDVGVLSVGAKIRDKDAGVSEYNATVRSIVTVEGLCALTRQYVTHEGLATSMCAKLRIGSINAYINEVRAQTDKALTRAQAELLIRLAGRL